VFTSRKRELVARPRAYGRLPPDPFLWVKPHWTHAAEPIDPSLSGSPGWVLVLQASCAFVFDNLAREHLETHHFMRSQSDSSTLVRGRRPLSPGIAGRVVDHQPALINAVSRDASRLELDETREGVHPAFEIHSRSMKEARRG